MPFNLALARKRQFQLIIENLRNLAERFEECRSYIESSSDLFTMDDEHLDTLNIKDLNQKQILSKVARKRLEQYPSQRAAAESLGIDVRTLKKYAYWREEND